MKKLFLFFVEYLLFLPQIWVPPHGLILSVHFGAAVFVSSVPFLIRAGAVKVWLIFPRIRFGSHWDFFHY
jgi:hypothetical protein